MSYDAAMDSMVLRAKVQTARVDGRTIVQVTVLDEDTHETLELLMPPGYVANPSAGSDALEVQIGAFGSHKVALGGDNTADALTDLESGEHGLSSAATSQQLILRLTGTEIVTALLQWGPTRDALKRLVQEEFKALFNMHTHPTPSGTSGPPNQPMTDAHLTGPP